MNLLEKIHQIYENERNIIINKYKKIFLIILMYLFVCSLGISSLHFFELDSHPIQRIIVMMIALIVFLNTIFSTGVFFIKCKTYHFLAILGFVGLFVAYINIPFMIFGDNETSFFTLLQMITVIHPLILIGLYFKLDFEIDVDFDIKTDKLNSKKIALFNDCFINNEPIFTENDNKILLLNSLIKRNENNTLNDDIKNELVLVDKLNKSKVKYIIEPNSIFVKFIKDIITNDNLICEKHKIKRALTNEMKPINNVIQKEIAKQKDLIQNNQFIFNERSHQWCSYNKFNELETKEIDLIKQLDDKNIQLNQDVVDKWKKEFEQIKQEKTKYAEEIKQKTLDLENFIKNSLIQELRKFS